jgi:hypothetical protein
MGPMSQICGMLKNSLFDGQITGHFSPTVHAFLLGVSHIVVGVGAPGGASWGFQSWAHTISLMASGRHQPLGPIEEATLAYLIS